MGVSTAVTDRSIGRTLAWRPWVMALVVLAWAALFAGAYAIGSSSSSTPSSNARQGGGAALAAGTDVSAAAASTTSSRAATAKVTGLSSVPAPPALKAKAKPPAKPVTHTTAVSRPAVRTVRRYVYVAPRVTTPPVRSTTPSTPVTSPTRGTSSGGSTTSTPSGGSAPGTGTTSGGG